MIGLGASSSIISKQLADLLELPYEPINKPVVQLDGSSVNTLGVIKDLSLSLHECPNFSIPQDIYAIDLPPHFVICLSREFTARIGGYLSADWSHLYFRTRYGTKVRIKSKAFAKTHVEPYTPSPINANLMYHEQESSDFESETSDQKILDIALDEWVERNLEEDDPFKNMDISGIGMFIIHEGDIVIPELIKKEDKISASHDDDLWQLFFDGARNRVGLGGGAVLISLEGEKYYSAIHFSFRCTNNTIEYEALIHGLKWARQRGIKNLKVTGDRELVVNQIYGTNLTKSDTLKMYKHRVWDLIEGFCAFNLVAIPRN